MAQRRRPVFPLGLGAVLMITTSQAALAFTECASRGGVVTTLSTSADAAQSIQNFNASQFVCVVVTSGTNLTLTGDGSGPVNVLSAGGVEFVLESGATVAGTTGSEGVGLFSYNAASPVFVQVDGDISGQFGGLNSGSGHNGEDRYTINGRVTSSSGESDFDLYVYGARIDQIPDSANEEEVSAFAGTSDITVGQTGEVRGRGVGLYLNGGDYLLPDSVARQTAQFTVVNRGTIGLLSDFDGSAIWVSGSTADVTNFGLIEGGLTFAQRNNVFSNEATGTVDLSDSFMNFAGDGEVDNGPFSPNYQAPLWGNDVVRNSGTMLAYGTTTISYLDRFEMNGGVIRMDDGQADSLFSAGDDSAFFGAETTFVANGGEVRMDVVLGDDTSASDRLVFWNVRLEDTPTALRFTNVGGTGGLTDRGILVVGVDGQSDPGAFVLANEAPLEVGAFVYDLTFYNEVDDQNWYLTTTGAVGPTATIYESAPALVFGAFGRMPTLAQRVGERQVGAGRDGFWLRGWGESGTATPDSSTAGAAWDFSGGGLQVGYDRTMQDTGAGRLVLGVTAQIGQASADVTNAAGAGTIEMDAAGLGLTATWYHDSGFYLDGQLSVNRVSADFATAAAGTLARGEEGTLTSFSLEAGRRFAVGANAALVPQAQLTFGRLNGADFTDASGNAVDLGSQSMTTARLGLAWEYRNPETPGTTVYIIGNLLRDLASETTVTVDGTTLTAKNDRTWAEIGLGGTFALNATTTAYAEGSYRTATDGGDNDAFALTAGFRKVW